MHLPNELLTPRLRLRRPVLSDAEEVFRRYGHDPVVCRYMSWTPHASVSDTAAYLQRVLDAREEKSHKYLIFARDSGLLLGTVGGGIDGTERRRVQFGYCLARDAWGKGYATEAAHAFVAAVLEDPAVWRVQAHCHVENVASARVLEKCGMTLEGTLRRYAVLPNLGDAPCDMRCYARVRE